MRRLFLMVGALLLAAGAGYFVADFREQQARRPMPMTDVPVMPSSPATVTTERLFALTLPDGQSKPQALRQWQGRVLVVNFWATWCAPCREEIPAFSRLQEKYSAKNIQFVGIALDSVDKVTEFSRQVHLAYPSLIARQIPPGLMADLGDPAGGVPFTVVIGRDGRVVKSRLGIWREETLANILDELPR